MGRLDRQLSSAESQCSMGWWLSKGREERRLLSRVSSSSWEHCSIPLKGQWVDANQREQDRGGQRERERDGEEGERREKRKRREGGEKRGRGERESV